MKIVRRVFSLLFLVLGGIAGWEARGLFQPTGGPPSFSWPFASSAAVRPVLIDGVPDVRQSTPYSCGAAALQAILHFNGIEAREDELMKELRTTSAQGTHPESILRVARERGLRAELREGLGLEDLRASLQRGVPVIADIQAWTNGKPAGFSWKDDWEDGHYVIVLGMDSNHIYVEDPSLLGCRGTIPRQEFLERWHDYEGDPPYDASDRAYVHMGIFIEGGIKGKFPPFRRVD